MWLQPWRRPSRQWLRPCVPHTRAGVLQCTLLAGILLLLVVFYAEQLLTLHKLPNVGQLLDQLASFAILPFLPEHSGYVIAQLAFWRKAVIHDAVALPAEEMPGDGVLEMLHWTGWFNPELEKREVRATVDCRAVCNRTVVMHPNRTRQAAAAAIIFHAPNWDPLDLPARRDVPWVWRSMESPAVYPVQTTASFASHFNMTMTYRLDAEGFEAYVPSARELVQERWPGVATDRPLLGAPVVYLASHCRVSSGRDLYVEELMRHIGVDSLGKCLHGHADDVDDSNHSVRGEEMLDLWVRRGYRFVLALENSDCDDYVTEKVFNALKVGVLPVYLGARNVRQFLPDPKAVILLNDFGSPRELAAHLQHLLANPAEYERHVRWRRQGLADVPGFSAMYARLMSANHPKTGNVDKHCGLCRAVVEGRSRVVPPDLSCGLDGIDETHPWREYSRWRAWLPARICDWFGI